MPDLEIKLNSGLKTCSIEFIQNLEEKMDKALILEGFSRTNTSKLEDSVELHYRQFGKCL